MLNKHNINLSIGHPLIKGLEREPLTHCKRSHLRTLFLLGKVTFDEHVHVFERSWKVDITDIY